MLIALSTVKWAYEWASVCANKRFFPITIGINFLVQLPMLQQSMWWGILKWKFHVFSAKLKMPFACKTIRLKHLNFNLHAILVSPIVATVNLEVSETVEISICGIGFYSKKKSISISLREFFIFDFAHERDKMSPYDLMSSFI